MGSAALGSVFCVTPAIKGNAVYLYNAFHVDCTTCCYPALMTRFMDNLPLENQILKI